MISPVPGIIWIPIIRTMKSFRPVNRYFASATAARNASTIEMATATTTMMMVFFTTSQKNALWIASLKCPSVGLPENHVGVRLLI